MAFGKDKPSVPKYQEMADTPWMTRNRELNTTSYNNLNRDLNRVNVFDDATKQQLNAVVDDWYNRSLSDFDRSYNDTMRRTLARDYNRFGTTGNANSLLSRDYQNIMSQRALADLASNRSDRYDDLIQRELNNRYKWLDTNYNYFTDSGKVTQDNDLRNWAIRNQNLDRQYYNDVQDYNNSFGHQLGKVATAVGAGLGTMVNPALGMAIYGAGNALNSDAQNLLGGANGGINLGLDYNTIFGIGAGLGSRYGTNFWNDGSVIGNLLGDQITRTQPSSNTIMNFLSGLWDRDGIPRDTRGDFTDTDGRRIIIG